MTSGQRAERDAEGGAALEEAPPETATSGTRESTGGEAQEHEPDSRAEAEARVGGRLGPYRLEEVLGVGGTAAVYRAVATNEDGAAVALKVLHASLCRDSRARKRFLREAQIAKWLAHPRVVRILATGEEPDGTAYHVMDLHEGETLEKRRSSAPEGLPCDTVIPWMEDLLSVLALAHARGIVHRDVKPANLLLDRAGRVHVLDFGIVRMGPEQGTASLVTRSGVLLGTVPFMPPEQALGRSEEIDARTDVWAVGATMFTLITGKLVHAARSVNEALVLAATQPAVPVRQVDPSVPKPLAAVIDRALAFDKAERFADARAMRSALRRACGRDEDEDEDAEAGERGGAKGDASTLPEESLPEGLHRAPAIAGLPQAIRPRTKRLLLLAALVIAAGTAAAWGALREQGSAGSGATAAVPTATDVAGGAPSSATEPPSAKGASLPPVTASARGPAPSDTAATAPGQGGTTATKPPVPADTGAARSGVGGSATASPKTTAAQPPPLPKASPSVTLPPF